MRNIADIVDQNDPEGRTFREINNAKFHKIKLGVLVELENGVRLYTVFFGRDCDGTPLYSLSPKSPVDEPGTAHNYHWTGGYSEESLTVLNKKAECDAMS